MKALLAILIVGCTDEIVAKSAPDAGAADASSIPPGADAASGADAATAVDAGPPASTMPAPLVPGAGFYPRAIRASGGAILASVVTPLPSGHLGGTILESTDDGLTFVPVGAIDDPVASSGLCCATLYELPRALGALRAGTLLWSASVGGDTPAQPMSIRVWASSDVGRTWSALATVAVGAVPRSRGGLWEPEFSMLDDGTLVCQYSDETDAAHSQKLVEKRSADGVAWGSLRNTVAIPAFGQRPGMPNVRRLPGGAFVMSYEICGVANDNCTAHLRRSNDGWDWGDAANPGLRPATLDGKHFRHAPTLVWNDTPGQNGRFYLIGQMVYDAGGNVAPENGGIVLANTEGGFQNWYEILAPVKIDAPYDNFCPNYSSTLLPLDSGTVGLEIASRWDGNQCRPYFARGPLLGTHDAAGIEGGRTYRLVNVMSGLCLDVAGGSTAAGDNVQQWTCNALAPQNWQVAPMAAGAFALRAQNSGLCLTVAGGATTPGANVEQQPCNGSAAQAWLVKNVGLGYYVLAHAGSDSCLDVAGGSLAAGGNVQQWSCNDLSPQIWRLELR